MTTKLKYALFLLLASVLAVFLSDYFRIVLIAIESLPMALEHVFARLISEGGAHLHIAYGMIMWITTFTYSALLLGGYWLMNRRLPAHYQHLILAVWFVVYVVMALGPETLGLSTSV